MYLGERYRNRNYTIRICSLMSLNQCILNGKYKRIFLKKASKERHEVIIVFVGIGSYENL